MNIVILAPSGGGKGTTAAFIVRDFNLKHISSGDIFRDNVKRETELGLRVKGYINRGEWVPDSVVVDVIMDRLSQPDCENGVILDGTPRTLQQAIALDNSMTIHASIELDVDDETVIARLGGRKTCTMCNAVQKGGSSCYVCDGELYIRADDTDELIKKRLAAYHEFVQPLREYYEKTDRHIRVRISSTDKPEFVYEQIKSRLDNISR